MKQYRYELKTADGRACCSGNNLKHLCPACRMAAQDQGKNDAPNPWNATPKAVKVVLDTNGVPRPYATTKETDK